MNPKGEKLGTCGLEGIKESLTEPLKVTKNLTPGLGCWILLLGDQISVAALGFVLGTCLNPIGWTQSQQS